MALKPRINSDFVLAKMVEVAQLADFHEAVSRLGSGKRPPRGFWEAVSLRLPESERKSNEALSNWWARVKDENLSTFLSLCEQPEPATGTVEELASTDGRVEPEEPEQESGERVAIAYQGEPVDASGFEEEPSALAETSKTSNEPEIPLGLLDVLRPMIQDIVDDFQKNQTLQIEALRARVEEMANRMTDHQKLPIVQADLKMPPKPKRKIATDKDGKEIQSRAFLVRRESLQGTVDAALHKLFEEDRTARGRGVSQMLDLILYNFYGKPPLSFQQVDQDA